VDRAVTQRRLDRESYLTELTTRAARTITAFLEHHLNEPEPFTEKADEIAGARALMEFHHRVDAATSRIIGRVAAKAPALPEDLEVLDVIAHQLPVVTQQATDAHQATIRRLIARGVGQLKVILVAYVAFLVVGGSCGAAGMVVFSQTVSLPLRRLASATLDIAAGNFAKRVPIGSRDEIGQLSPPFNDGAPRAGGRLQRRVNSRAWETQALHRIGVEISSLLEIDTILRSVVELAQTLLQCQGAALCLFRSTGEGLDVSAVSGLMEASAVNVEAAELLCLAKAGARLSPGSVSCSACMTLEGGPPATCLAATLRQGEDVLGIPGVGRRRNFNDDQKLLDGLAQAAAAGRGSTRR
jgi:HAMP domain-containing protein